MILESEGWSRLGELKIHERNLEISVNQLGRLKAYHLNADDGMEEVREVFLDMNDLARKHPDWLISLVLETENESLLEQYEKTIADIKQLHPSILSQ